MRKNNLHFIAAVAVCLAGLWGCNTLDFPTDEYEKVSKDTYLLYHSFAEDQGGDNILSVPCDSKSFVELLQSGVWKYSEYDCVVRKGKARRYSITVLKDEPDWIGGFRGYDIIISFGENGLQVDTTKTRGTNRIVNISQHEYSMQDDGSGVFRSKPATLIYQSKWRVVLDCEDPSPKIEDYKKSSTYQTFKRIILEKMY